MKLSDEAMLLMYRCIKTACHEICHVLGMTHCPYYECLMNGSNLVTEADIKPFALCPICLRKLAAYFQIQNRLADRYFRLIEVIEANENKRFRKELQLFNDIARTLQERGLAVKFVIVQKGEGKKTT